MVRKRPKRDTGKKPNTVFTPDNEPYLGRETVFAFDKLIIVCLESNTEIASRTYKMDNMTDLQRAACQLIPQGLSISLSIRELVRQGHLFGGLVLIRALAERATTVLYLQRFPDEIVKWKRGWRYNERPSLHKMLDTISMGKFPGAAREFTQLYNSIMHGDPDSAMWNLVQVSNGKLSHAVSKILKNPSLCDKVCLDAAIWLGVLLGMTNVIFPRGEEEKQNSPIFDPSIKSMLTRAVQLVEESESIPLTQDEAR